MPIIFNTLDSEFVSVLPPAVVFLNEKRRNPKREKNKNSDSEQTDQSLDENAEMRLRNARISARAAARECTQHQKQKIVGRYNELLTHDQPRADRYLANVLNCRLPGLPLAMIGEEGEMLIEAEVAAKAHRRWRWRLLLLLLTRTAAAAISVDVDG